MEDIMLSEDYENMAVKGNSGTISRWLSSMTTDHRGGSGHTERISAFRMKETEPKGVAFRNHGAGVVVPIL